MLRTLLAVLLLFAAGAAANSKAEIERRDYFVENDPGVRLFVR